MRNLKQIGVRLLIEWMNDIETVKAGALRYLRASDFCELVYVGILVVLIALTSNLCCFLLIDLRFDYTIKLIVNFVNIFNTEYIWKKQMATLADSLTWLLRLLTIFDVLF